MQVLITSRTLEDFTQQVNHLLRDGFQIVIGTSYATSFKSNDTYPVKGDDQFFSVTLNHNQQGQILITSPDRFTFSTEVKNFLNRGYQVIPGTIYATDLKGGETTEEIETFYSVFLWR